MMQSTIYSRCCSQKQVSDNTAKPDWSHTFCSKVALREVFSVSWSWLKPYWLAALELHKCSPSYSNGWWAELISERQDGSWVYVMLHPLCQARLAQHRGEKGMNKHMSKENKGTDSFQSGWLPGCDIAHVEILQLCWDTAGHKSRVIQHSRTSEQVCFGEGGYRREWF